MRRNLLGIALLLCTGCSQLPQWNTAERQTTETELENAKANIETTIESAKKDISRLSGMKTREQENK